MMIRWEHAAGRDMTTVDVYSRHAPDIVFVLCRFACDSSRCSCNFVACFEVDLHVIVLFVKLAVAEESWDDVPCLFWSSNSTWKRCFCFPRTVVTPTACDSNSVIWMSAADFSSCLPVRNQPVVDQLPVCRTCPMRIPEVIFFPDW